MGAPTVAALLLAGTLLVAGCGREDERVDSAQRFKGEAHAIARVIEDYEAAVRAGDAETLCRRVLHPGRRASPARTRRCVRDQDNDALRGSADAREALDLIARRIEFIPRRTGEVPGIPEAVPRYQIEWGLEGAPPAVALVERADRDTPGADAFSLKRSDGRWRISSRWRAREIEPPDAPRARVGFFKRHGVLGFYGLAARERLRCPGGTQAGITHGILAPDRATGVRDAVMRSDIAPELRRAFRDGASLHLSTVDYGELRRGFSLLLPSGRTVVSFPMWGPGPRYITADIWGCRGWIERITHVGTR